MKDINMKQKPKQNGLNDNRAEMCAACNNMIEAGERRMRPVKFPTYPVHMQCGLSMAFVMSDAALVGTFL
jgi:hypothetical protein